MGVLKIFYTLCGIFLFTLGIIGVVLPIIPGWPFLIPALYCFYKASPELARRIVSSPRFKKFIPKSVDKYLKKYEVMK